jgi:hypothetical protein
MPVLTCEWIAGTRQVQDVNGCEQRRLARSNGRDHHRHPHGGQKDHDRSKQHDDLTSGKVVESAVER